MWHFKCRTGLFHGINNAIQIMEPFEYLETFTVNKGGKNLLKTPTSSVFICILVYGCINRALQGLILMTALKRVIKFTATILFVLLTINRITSWLKSRNENMYFEFTFCCFELFHTIKFLKLRLTIVDLLFFIFLHFVTKALFNFFKLYN